MSNYSNLKIDLNSRNSPWVKMLQFVPDGAEVLDIGCSSGNFGHALRAIKNCSVDGVDITESDIALAKENLRSAHVANVEHEPLTKLLSGRTYDVVVMADVIEHMVDPVAGLGNVLSVLRPNGVVLFSIPNMTHISIRLGLLMGEFTYTETGILDKTHVHFYDADAVDKVFLDSGFLVEQYDSTVVNMPRDMIRERLATAGLIAEEKFFELLNENFGHIYQFVGVATRLGDRPRPSRRYDLRVTRSPAEDIQAHIGNLERIWKDKEIALLNEIRQIQLLGGPRHALKKLERSAVKAFKKLTKPKPRS